ncbi:MAG: pyruvate, phosphate dikinase [Tissierellia bacterium]|nr:pyruvate, phosphate dikinase [Tissierellia bacterium]
MTKYVYSFKEGNKDMRSLMGGKGANLAEMTNMGINVPTGFCITTEACNRFLDEDKVLWDSLFDEIKGHIEEVEKDLNKKFSDTENPLLFSVRSGAVFSMPGMMDTILNLGLNDQAVKGLAHSTGNERFAYDSYRRFIQMFSDVAMEIPGVLFEDRLSEMKKRHGAELDNDLTADHLKELVEEFKEIYKEEMGEDFPQEPMDQLRFAIEAVFKSWDNPRARVYRKLNDIPDNLGTAVNVQSMVFGNMGKTSGTGVAFTRNPATGENVLFGEYLMDAQGEDVVAGIRTPEPISHLEDIMPHLFHEFKDTAMKLEEHYQDMQDLEFTIENERLFILQTRNGKRTADAALNIAVDMVEEGLITKEEAIMRVEPKSLDQLLHPNFDEKELKEAQVITKGLAASPGAASGRVYFHASDIVKNTKDGVKTILVRQETSPEDIEGMINAEGIVTARGGMTSHAAVVARGMGKCCVAGASEIHVDEDQRVFKCRDIEIKEGDLISIDGSTGNIYLGDIQKVEPKLTGNFGKFMEWVDEERQLGVRTNADSPKDAKQALEFGAEGIGLTRTEHMFFTEDRIPAVREMILSKSIEQRKKALDKIRPMQEEDFYGIYEAMGERPVTIRLLDPPLHEFLPTSTQEIEKLASDMNLTVEDVRGTIGELQEVNPMLGHRGCRLAITFPEIYRMQVRAIMTAALRVKKDKNIEILPEIMIPLVSDVKELKYVKDEITDEIEMVFEEMDDRMDYHIGTMIEIPRAALLADEIATEADFFSFGTNDLTQMTFGFSRDDSGKFLTEYAEKKIYPVSPFERLDQHGVGILVENAVKLGRKTKENIHMGICGEHGGDPETIQFCHKIGLDYVSCSPFRVPIARLAAAQVAIAERNQEQ